MYWYNGRLQETDQISLSIDDPGWLYGATIFTTLRVYGQSLDHPLTNWQAHLERLRAHLNSLGFQQPKLEHLYQGAQALLPFYGVLRLTIFVDGRELIIGRPLPQDLDLWQQEGITAWVAPPNPYHRPQANYKTGNYLGAYLAGQAAQQQGAQIAILTAPQGHWLETHTGNLWGYRQGCWYTPPATGEILVGVARQKLKQWLEEQGIEVKETAWTEELTEELEAIAYSNSVVQVIPLAKILKGEDLRILDPQHSCFEELNSYYRTRR